MTIVNFEIAPNSSVIKANWYDAKLYCFSLTIGGKTGWRLPTKEEFNHICKSDHDFAENDYWSSTEVNTGYAWVQSFGFGNGGQYPGGKNFNNYVRAIRTTV
jgi:formylglycine-generating enzyme required for sulfatase activity